MDYFGDDLTRLIQSFIDALKKAQNKQLILDAFLSAYPYTKTRAILERVYNSQED